MKGKFRILGRIGLGVFMVCALMLAFMPVAPVSAVTAVEDVWVEFPSTDETGAIDATLYFNKAASVLLWRIHFTPTTALKRGVDTIVVQFYDGLDSTMGPTETQDTFDVEFGGNVSTATNYDIDPDAMGTDHGYYDCRTVSQAGYRVTVTTPCDIAAGQEAWLLIDDDDMITSGGANKAAPNTAAYKVKVHTSQDTTPVLSHGFYHGTADVTFTSVAVSPNTAGSSGQYTFTFEPASALTANADTITVTFPYGTTVPSTISASNIIVYDGTGSTEYTCGADAIVDTDLRTAKVTVPYGISGSGCYIKFAAAAGITNPTYGATDYGENDVDATNRIAFIRTSDEQLDIALAHGSGNYAITERPATTLDFDYSAAPTLVTGLSDKYTMINMYSSILYLQVEDQYGNLCDTGATAAAQVTLSSSSGTGNFYTGYGLTAYTQITGTETLASGVEEIYYRDSTAGTHTLTASYSGLDDATWTITVCPGASLYDRYDNLIHTYAPTISTPVQETDIASDPTDLDVYKGGYYVDNAIDDATAYDVIVLGDGHYEVDASTNKVLVDEAYITLKSLNGADSTTIDSSAGASQILDVTAANVTIEDLTIQGITTTSGCRGIYLRYGGFTIQNNKFIDIPNDSIFVESAAGAITSGTIDSNTITGIGPGSGSNRGGIHIAASDSANGYDISGVSITNNTISAYSGYGTNGIKLAGSRVADNVGLATATISGNTISDCHYGLYFRGDCSATEMGGAKAIASNTISDCYTGVCLRWGNAAAFSMVKNTITNNGKYGIYLSDTGDALTAVLKIYYNDISGNGTWGILNYFASVTTAPDCKYNWFGDATGPGAGTGTWASTTAQGSGDAVSKNVTWEPWLHKSLTDVVADNVSYQAANMKLVAGWNTLSTPVQLIESADSVQELIPSGMTIGYYYDATGWHQITDTYVLDPCDAVYVKMSAITYVLLKFDAGAFTTPSKDLAVGWNLCSLAYLSSSGMTDIATVASVAKTAANLPGYSQLVSPSLNAAQTDLYGTARTSWAYAYGQTGGTYSCYPGLGYWVYMQNAATLAGFEITPIVPDFEP